MTVFGQRAHLCYVETASQPVSTSKFIAALFQPTVLRMRHCAQSENQRMPPCNTRYGIPMHRKQRTSAQRVT